MTYDVDGLRPATTTSFESGTSLLVSGPTRLARARLLDLIAAGSANEESAIVISADISAGEVIEALRERGPLPPGRVGIVDCTDGAGGEGVEDARVAQVSTPADLTGISLEFAKLVDWLQESGMAGRLRVGVASVSTLLMYGDLQTVFRFLHVFTSRIGSAGMFGAFSIDPDMHDGQAYNTVRAIFDCEATVDSDGVSLRGSGYSVRDDG